MLKAVLFDLDGTVYAGKNPIKGVKETINKLRKSGIQIFFISNASMRTRNEIVEVLNKMGIKCLEKEVYNSAYVSAKYIVSKFPGARVYCISLGGLQQELKEAGVKITKKEDANIVLAGLDTNFTYDKLKTAFRAIYYNKAKFFATNKDHVYTLENGLVPGGGTIVAALECASRKKAINLGKPETYLLDILLKENKLKKNEILVVGDNYETDILMAKKANVKCVLVLSGVTKRSELKKLNKKQMPDFVIEKITELAYITNTPPPISY